MDFLSHFVEHLESRSSIVSIVGDDLGSANRELSSAVINALYTADRSGMKTVSIPAISAGNCGFPVDMACETLVHQIW